MKPMNELAIEYRPLRELKANPKNVRTHSKKQIEAIACSIEELGFAVPILVDGNDTVIAGHGRMAAARLRGIERVPVIKLADLTEPQARILALADNRLAERAGWDRDRLAVELTELAVVLPELGLSLELTGFETPEIDGLMADVEEEKAQDQDDEVLPVADAAVAKPGDVWVLGRHRIVCGDARDGDVVRQLVGDERVDMVFTDPPFNVPVAGHVMVRGLVKHPDFQMAAGEMSEDEFIAFLRTVLERAVEVSRPGALHYVAMDWRHIAELITAAKPIYGEMKNLVVWAKTNWGLGSLYRSQHELIALFKVADAPHVNNVELGVHGRSRSNVWHYAGANVLKANRSAELAAHPTVKPVALVADAIRDVTKRNAVVLDLFGGSGTTLIAAERTGRRARLIEIEPRYVDVTIRRFEALTRADAVHAETGMTFADVATDRRVAG